MAFSDLHILASACLGWSVGIFIVQFIGISRLFRNFSKVPRPPISPSLPSSQIPHVTIIRPVKGLEPGLYECIAATFKQDYPVDKLSIRLCISEKSDPAYPVLQRIINDFPEFDAQVLVEEEDPVLHGVNGHVNNLGPNPKIRNISRAYREAPGDIIWIADCNVWIGHGVAGRMVDKLMGFRAGGQRGPMYKFVHQLPLLVDIDRPKTAGTEPLLSVASSFTPTISGTPVSTPRRKIQSLSNAFSSGGGLLDEMFMATSHAKFYSAINTVSVAPCIVGKSNMFRKSHLDMLTDPDQNPVLKGQDKSHPKGIDYFSIYICEDHLIGDLLWRSKIPGFRNHGMCLGDFAIQPTSSMPVSAFFARRSRWLRARKWTVPAATIVEPGVESLVCCGAFAYAATSLPWFANRLGIPPTSTAQFIIWALAVLLWMMFDYMTFCMLHRGSSIEADHDTPMWARGTEKNEGSTRRPFRQWALTWIGRELLALPIWTYAVLLGTTVNWRGRSFRVRMDMRVVELQKTDNYMICGSDGSQARYSPTHRGNGSGTRTPEIEMGRSASDSRRLD
ncbi:Ceramide glucosyltransferase [Ceratocystis fimbriata CBS 114723]|uniref:Ceramide glucosyltransferase n=1 Tax=Ceratocystis fimbriata CBS 114723 TaxID=1035309 RepID=A0A2C5WVC2_9PEZI|nr:Ceramide glucosyltransferase [Ceratocystis fimbriata CBS 114723]